MITNFQVVQLSWINEHEEFIEFDVEFEYNGIKYDEPCRFYFEDEEFLVSPYWVDHMESISKEKRNESIHESEKIAKEIIMNDKRWRLDFLFKNYEDME